jgi:hypothetical protein
LASKYVLSALKPEVSTALSATATVGYMLKNIDNQTTLPTRVARTVYMVDARRRGVQGCCTISLISWVIGSGEVCWKHRAISDRFFK